MDTEILFEMLATLGADEAAKTIRELDSKDPVTAAVLNLLANEIERNGVEGAIAIKDLISKKGRGAINLLGLRALHVRHRSDLIAELERDEVATNMKARAVANVVVNALSKIGAAMIGALLKS